jgi:hypothetical protein
MVRRAENLEKLAPAERRRNLRFPFSASIEAVEDKSGTRIKGRTSDLGLGGCFMDTLSPFSQGCVVTVTILKDNESFQAKAKVVYSLVGMGMGLAFIAADPNQVKLFQRWILELNGQQPLAPAPPAGAAENGQASAPAEGANNESQYVLSELIIALIRKGVLDKADGNAMLRKLNR